MKRIYVFIFAGFVALLLNANISQAFQQTRIEGQLLDSESRTPLAGATIALMSKGIKVGSDQNGRFAINASIGDTLEITYIGYVVKRQIVNKSKLVIFLDRAANSLDDVVIIGYGSVEKRDITGSVGQVNMEELTKAPVASFAEALAGRISGVQVNSDDGQPGAEMNIVIRGGNSLTQSNSPLYVVDGFPMEDFASAALNPDDIASISILKDASATAIYGSRGANGVMIIETKKGMSGQPSVSINSYVGSQSKTNSMDLLNPYEYVKLMLERDSVEFGKRYLTRPGLSLEDYRNVKAIDWQDMLFRSTFMQSHNLSLRGGTDQTKYAISTSIFDQEGIVLNSGFSRYQGRITLDQTISKKLKASLSLNYSHDKNFGALTSEQGSSSNAYSTYLMYQLWAYKPFILNSGADIENDIFIDSEDEEEAFKLMNPLVSTSNQLRQRMRNNLLTNASISYEISKDLTFVARGGFNTKMTRNERFYNTKTYQGYPYGSNVKGVNGAYDDSHLNDWMNEEVLTYKKAFNKNHKFDATVGVSLQGTNSNRYGYEVYNIAHEQMGLNALEMGIPNSVISSRSENVLASYLARVNYSLNSKYLFTASFRADGSSKFSTDNRWGYFPSGAFAWQMGREKFMKKLKFISDAKLRLSYGVTGNNRVRDFVRYTTVELSDYYSFNNGIPTFASNINNLGDRDLKWETTAQANIGYDLSLFKNRLNLEVDAYSKTTSDLLLNANLPNSTGFSTIYTNIGRIRNTGLEFTLNSKNIRTRNFSWESSFNIGFNRNEILELTEGQQTLFSLVRWTGDFNSSFLYLAKVGESAADFFGYVWEGNYQYSDFLENADGSYTLKNSVPSNGTARTAIRPGDIKYADQNGDGIVNEEDRVVIGRGLPVHSGGFNNNFTYKGFGLNVFFQWSYGNDIYNANRILFEGGTNRNINLYATYLDRWTEENQSNTYFRDKGRGPNGMYSSRTIEDGSYLRLKTVELSYTLPKLVVSKLKMKQISLFSAGQNLYTWTNYSGMDPEVSVRNTVLTPGFDYSAYPRARTFTFGVKATF